MSDGRFDVLIVVPIIPTEGRELKRGIVGCILAPALGLNKSGTAWIGGRPSAGAAVGGLATDGKFLSGSFSSFGSAKGSGTFRMENMPDGLDHGLGMSSLSSCFLGL